MCKRLKIIKRNWPRYKRYFEKVKMIAKSFDFLKFIAKIIDFF